MTGVLDGENVLRVLSNGVIYNLDLDSRFGLDCRKRFPVTLWDGEFTESSLASGTFSFIVALCIIFLLGIDSVAPDNGSLSFVQFGLPSLAVD